jgi:hypothetical protein
MAVGSAVATEQLHAVCRHTVDHHREQQTEQQNGAWNTQKSTVELVRGAVFDAHETSDIHECDWILFLINF